MEVGGGKWGIHMGMKENPHVHTARTQTQLSWQVRLHQASRRTGWMEPPAGCPLFNRF